jgi:glycosyltransferase involved in cell wall biosynthesis
MKIIAFSNLYPPVYIGGYEIGAAQVVEELRRRGHEVLVLTAHDYFFQQATGFLHQEHAPAERATLLDAGLCVFGSLTTLAKQQPIAFLRRVWGTFWARRTYRERIRAFQPDAFLVFNPWGVVAPVIDDFVAWSRTSGAPVHAYVSDHWLAAWPTGNPLWPLLHRLHGSQRRWVRAAGKVFHKVLRECRWVADPLPLFDGYFYCSDYIRRLSRENSVGIAEHTVAHWGLPEVERLPSVGPEHFNGPLPLTLLYAGQLLPHKGLKVLLRALLYCQKQHRLVVVGDDSTDYAAQCKSLAAKLGLGERVFFAGRKKHAEMLELMAHTGHLLVVPSEWDEPFSIVVLEGMGVGLPVLASDTGGTAEGIVDGENGFLFNRSDSRGLGALIDRLEADRALCRRVGARARQEVLTRYTMPGLVDRILARLEGRSTETPVRWAA